MIELHPEILNREGKKFIVLTNEEFENVRELLNDYEDLLDLRAAKSEESGEPVISLRDLKIDFKL
jgi:hypothetical protein